MTYDSVGGTEIKVCASSSTQEEPARNLRQMAWPFIWKDARRLKARLPFKPATRQRLAQFSLNELLIRNGMPLSSEERGV